MENEQETIKDEHVEEIMVDRCGRCFNVPDWHKMLCAKWAIKTTKKQSLLNAKPQYTAYCFTQQDS